MSTGNKAFSIIGPCSSVLMQLLLTIDTAVSAKIL